MGLLLSVLELQVKALEGHVLRGAGFLSILVVRVEGLVEVLAVFILKV